jgi:uncharacterized damage-inducible protein DinB
MLKGFHGQFASAATSRPGAGVIKKRSDQMNTHTVQMLAEYRAWADRVMFEAVATLPPGEASKERNTLFKTIIGTLNHIYVVDLIWHAHLEGREHGFKSRKLSPHSELPELWTAQQKINNWVIDWSKAQSEGSLDEKVPFTFVNGTKAVMTRGEMFLHLVTHDSYHRGWVAEMIFETGAEPPQTDLSVFLCDAP